MCLIILAHLAREDARYWLAANRDERRDRPSEPIQLLNSAPPIIGGRDLNAGGTWLATGAHGLVVGLTNQSGAWRDASKRSRGELPLLLASQADAASAAEVARELEPTNYNACCLIIADPHRAYYVELIAKRPRVEELAPGVHVLENRPMASASAKAELIKGKLEGFDSWSEGSIAERLQGVLASRDLPSTPSEDRPAQLDSACVDLPNYGTRSATLVRATAGVPPKVWFADGVPGLAPFEVAEFPQVLPS
jgi:uncharacterized protein with NRDE domain